MKSSEEVSMRLNFKFMALIMFFVLFASFPWAFQPYQEHEHQQPLPDRHRDRWYWQMPHRIIDEAGIKPGMSVADVGAGDGYFTFRLAERVGPHGRVYANDIDNRALQVVRDKCREEDIRNITVILGKEDDPLLPEKSIDIILMVNVIHLVKNPSLFLKNIEKCLKPGGTLVIVQWDAEKMDSEMQEEQWDPVDRARYTLRTNLRKIYDADFEVVQIKEFLPMQKIYICQYKRFKHM